MKIDHKTKRLIFTAEELSDRSNFFETDSELFSQIMSIMVYPNDQDKQYLYTIGLRNKNIADLTEQTSEDERDSFLRSEHELYFELTRYKKEGLDAYKAAYSSRNKKNTGSLVVRGIAAGRILLHLVLDGANLTTSYNYAIEDFQDIGESVSESWMIRYAWGDYKHVSHMWAAYLIYSKMSDSKNNKCLSTFLRIASRLREKLVESTDPNKLRGLSSPEENYRIKAPENVWVLVDNNEKFIT